MDLAVPLVLLSPYCRLLVHLLSPGCRRTCWAWPCFRACRSKASAALSASLFTGGGYLAVALILLSPYCRLLVHPLSPGCRRTCWAWPCFRACRGKASAVLSASLFTGGGFGSCFDPSFAVLSAFGTSAFAGLSAHLLGLALLSRLPGQGFCRFVRFSLHRWWIFGGCFDPSFAALSAFGASAFAGLSAHLLGLALLSSLAGARLLPFCPLLFSPVVDLAVPLVLLSPYCRLLVHLLSPGCRRTCWAWPCFCACRGKAFTLAGLGPSWVSPGLGPLLVMLSSSSTQSLPIIL